MGVYRCPSSSDDLVSVASKEVAQSRASVGKRLSRLIVTSSHTTNSTVVPKPSRPRRSRKEEIIKRPKAGMDASKKHQHQIALAKLLNKRREAERRRGLSFVFVGNVDPCVTEVDIRNAFAQCGPILRVQKRCSYGVGVSLARDFPGRRALDRQYATVEFRDSRSVQKALQLDGASLYGLDMIVTLNADELPEWKRIRRLSPPPRPPRPTRKTETMLPFVSFLHRKRIIGPRDTETDFGDAGLQDAHAIRQKNVFHGISFPKTLM